jgi:hypothetical protein
MCNAPNPNWIYFDELSSIDDRRYLYVPHTSKVGNLSLCFFQQSTILTVANLS